MDFFFRKTHFKAKLDFEKKTLYNYQIIGDLFTLYSLQNRVNKKDDHKNYIEGGQISSYFDFQTQIFAAYC